MRQRVVGPQLQSSGGMSIYTVSTARVPLSVARHACRSLPTRSSVLSRRALTLRTVSGNSVSWITWRSVASECKVRRPRELPLLGPTHLTVSGRRALFAAGFQFPGRAVTSRTRARATEGPGIEAVALQGRAQGLGFRIDSAGCISVVSETVSFTAFRDGPYPPPVAHAAQWGLPSCPGCHRNRPRRRARA
jgi:hypothetical protein